MGTILKIFSFLPTCVTVEEIKITFAGITTVVFTYVHAKYLAIAIVNIHMFVLKCMMLGNLQELWEV